MTMERLYMTENDAELAMKRLTRSSDPVDEFELRPCAVPLPVAGIYGEGRERADSSRIQSGNHDVRLVHFL